VAAAVAPGWIDAVDDERIRDAHAVIETMLAPTNAQATARRKRFARAEEFRFSDQIFPAVIIKQ
jgi:hypothetical protein